MSRVTGSIESSFDAPTVNQVMQNITRTMPPRIRRVVPSVPTTLELICTTAIEKRPEHRYASMSTFASDLGAFLHARPLHAKAPSPFTRAVRRVQRRPMPYAVGLAVAVALVLGLGAGEAVARWSAMRKIRAMLAAVEAKAGFDPAREYTELFAAVDAAGEREWSIPLGSQSVIDSLREGMEAHLNEQFEGLKLRRLPGALFDPYPLAGEELSLASPDRFLAEREVEWAVWGVDSELQAQLRREILAGGLILEFDPPEAASLAQVELYPMEFVRTTVATADTQQREFLPGYALEPGRTYRGEVSYPDGTIHEFTVLPVDSGQARRLVLRPDAEVPAMVDFPEFQLEGYGAEEAWMDYFNFLEGSVGESFALADAYVSVGEFRAFEESVGAQFKLFRAFLPEQLNEAVLSQPAVGWTPNEAAAFCAWSGCRLPWLDELVAALGPFELDGRPTGISEDLFDSWKAAVRQSLSVPEASDSAGRISFQDQLIANYPAASASGALGAHSSGLSAWMFGLAELSGSPAMTRRIADLGAGSNPGVTAVDNTLTSRLEFRPASRVRIALRDGMESVFGFRCARSGRTLR